MSSQCEVERSYSEVRALPWFLRWRLPAERPMLLYVGRRGCGKSLATTDIIVRRLMDREKVYANYPVELWLHGRLFARAGYVGTLFDCVGLDDCTIVIDEATGWCGSREWQLLPPQIVSDWQQSRKRSVQWVFSAQNESRVDVVIRELVDWVVICRKDWLTPRWVPRFRLTETVFEDINEARRKEGGRRYTRWYKQRVFDAYNTDYEVPRMSRADLLAYKQAVKVGADLTPFYGATLVEPVWFE